MLKNITADNFATSSDEEIVAAGRRALQDAGDDLRPKYRKLLRSRRPDVTAMGTVLWASICNWNPVWLRKSRRTA